MKQKLQPHEQWAREVNFGKYYTKPMPKPSCHYFDAEVYTRALKKERQNLILNFLKNLFKL